MPSNTKKVVLALGLTASPLLMVAGCGGGGDGLSSPTPTVTSFPTPTIFPTATSIPESGAFKATFTNVTAPKIQSSFTAAGDAGTFYDGQNGKYEGSANIEIFDNGGINSRRVTLNLVTPPGKLLKSGDTITLSNDFSTGNPSYLQFDDFVDELSFQAKSGTVKIDSLVNNGGTVTLKITVTNAIMVPSSTNPSDNSSGQFTFNGTGTVEVANLV